MTVPLRSFDGAFKGLAAELWARGLRDNEQALDLVRTAGGRESLALELEVSPESLLEFACRVDLARISGIGERYAALLAGVGVRSVQELADQSPERLHASLGELMVRDHAAQRLPKPRQVSAWVEQAKSLPPILKI